MKVKKVIGECLIRAGKDDFSQSATLTEEQQETQNRLLACLNIVYREIVSKYLPLIHTENVVFQGGKCSAKSLSKTIVYPVRVQVGDEIKAFKTSADSVICSYSGDATLTYAYMPENDFAITDDIDDVRVTRSMLVNGTLAEYYFQNKVFDLAKSFDSDFRAETGIIRYKGRSVIIKRRGWHA